MRESTRFFIRLLAVLLVLGASIGLYPGKSSGQAGDPTEIVQVPAEPDDARRSKPSAAVECAGVVPADALVELERKAGAGNSTAAFCAGQVHQRAGRYLEARRWYDRVLEFEAFSDWEREQAGPEQNALWEGAYTRLRELYGEAPLFPRPFEGWSAEEIVVSKERVVVPMTGIFVRRTLSRSYRDEDGNEVSVRFHLNGTDGLFITGMHGGGSGEAKQEELAGRLQALGIKPFEEGDFRGTRSENPITGVSIAVLLCIAADGFENAVVRIEGAAADAYLERTNLPSARSLLEGHGFYPADFGF